MPNIDLLFESLIIVFSICPFLWLIVKAAVHKSIDHGLKLHLEEIKKNNAIEIEKIKLKLLETSSLSMEVYRRKMESYTRLFEIVYRIRKLSKTISDAISLEKKEIVNDYSFQCKSLEDLLYKSIIDLDSDLIFKNVHTFKNEALNFGIQANDIIYLLEHEKSKELAKGFTEELSNLQMKIEKNASIVLNLFSQKIKRHDGNE